MIPRLIENLRPRLLADANIIEELAFARQHLDPGIEDRARLNDKPRPRALGVGVELGLAGMSMAAILGS
jgi:hypothetical protein